MNSGQIGVIFTMYAIVTMLCQFLVYPPAVRYFGVLRSFRVVSALAPITYILMPFTVLLPSDWHQTAIFFIMCVKGAVGVFGFPSSMILLTNSVSSLRLLGTLNGVATSISAIGRGAGPAFTGWAFTLGVDAGYVIVAWWLLSIVGLAGHIVTYFLIEMEGPKPDDEIENDHSIEGEELEQQPLLAAEHTDETPGPYDGVKQSPH